MRIFKDKNDSSAPATSSAHSASPISPEGFIGYDAVRIVSNIRELSCQYLHEELEKSGAKGLVASHGNILGVLYMKGPLPMHEIASIIGRRKSTLTILANKLEELGFIERVDSQNDLRVKELKLTQKGFAFQEDFAKISQSLYDATWYAFEDQEKELCIQFLHRIQKNLENQSISVEKD